MFAMLWHGGMGCPIYWKFGQLERMQFRPSPCLNEPKDLGGECPRDLPPVGG